jgi:hypothetical protein
LRQRFFNVHVSSRKGELSLRSAQQVDRNIEAKYVQYNIMLAASI